MAHQKLAQRIGEISRTRSGTCVNLSLEIGAGAKHLVVIFIVRQRRRLLGTGDSDVIRPATARAASAGLAHAVGGIYNWSTSLILNRAGRPTVNDLQVVALGILLAAAGDGSPTTKARVICAVVIIA